MLITIKGWLILMMLVSCKTHEHSDVQDVIGSNPPRYAIERDLEETVGDTLSSIIKSATENKKAACFSDGVYENGRGPNPAIWLVNHPDKNCDDQTLNKNKPLILKENTHGNLIYQNKKVGETLRWCDVSGCYVEIIELCSGRYANNCRLNVSGDTPKLECLRDGECQ